ncbi:hypothetical protein NL676_006700 [Syzygium grande]|nr:hypothetical protein NL676_006700 [Syzygium grande]
MTDGGWAGGDGHGYEDGGSGGSTDLRLIVGQQQTESSNVGGVAGDVGLKQQKLRHWTGGQCYGGAAGQHLVAGVIADATGCLA